MSAVLKDELWYLRHITCEIVMLTPALAQDLLNNKAPNRAISSHTVDKYATEMTAGRWKFNGESIVISDKNQLMEGQHRCAAVIASKLAVPVLIVRGVDESVWATFNDLRPKRPADVLKRSGAENYPQEAGSLRALKHFEVRGTFANHGDARLSNSETLEVKARWPRISYWTRLTKSHGKFLILPATVAAVCAAYERLGHPSEKIERFITEVHSGANLSADNPALAYRNKAIDLKGPGVQVKQTAAAAYVIQALGDYLRDKPRRVIRWTDTQNFPSL